MACWRPQACRRGSRESWEVAAGSWSVFRGPETAFRLLHALMRAPATTGGWSSHGDSAATASRLNAGGPSSARRLEFNGRGSEPGHRGRSRPHNSLAGSIRSAQGRRSAWRNSQNPAQNHGEGIVVSRGRGQQGPAQQRQHEGQCANPRRASTFTEAESDYRQRAGCRVLQFRGQEPSRAAISEFQAWGGFPA